MNTLYEYGGIANVLIKTNIDTEIGGKVYKAGEPYTMLKDVYVVLGYEQATSPIAAKKPVSSSQSARPYRLTITNITLTKKVANLILTKCDDDVYTRTVSEKVFAIGKELYLANEPVENTPIFIYDSSGAAVSVEDSAANIITAEVEDGQEYLVYYTISSTGTKYKFEIPHYPYFTFEISGQGNKDKLTNQVYFKFPAVSIITTPNLDLVYDGILSTPLVADIIYQFQEEPTIVMG